MDDGRDQVGRRVGSREAAVIEERARIAKFFADVEPDDPEEYAAFLAGTDIDEGDEGDP